MNKKLLYLLISISSAVSIGIVGSFLFFIYKAELKSVTKISSDIHSAYLQEIIYNYKNDLVSGNYRSFRNQLASLIDHDIFSSYKLIQNGQNLDISDDFDKKSVLEIFTKITIPIWYDEARSSKWGEVELLVNTQSQTKFMTAFFEKIGSLLLWIFLIILLLVTIYAYLWQKLNFSLTRKVDQIFNGDVSISRQVGLSIWQPMLDQLAKLKSTNEELNRKNEISRMQEILFQITRQVAHDIRSPLSALNIMVNNIPEVAEEKRLIFKGAAGRINQIAEDLLRNGNIREIEGNPFYFRGPKMKVLTQVLVADVIQNIVNEKKIILGDKSCVTFEVDLPETMEAIVDGNQAELERVLSNLINNSIESFLCNSGKIIIRVAGYQEQVVVTVQDNGIGIPEDILIKLGGSEITSDKENGNGLGIYYAKKSIEEVGGKFDIQSRVGVGTMITIKLPTVKLIQPST